MDYYDELVSISKSEFKTISSKLIKYQLTDRQLCDLEMIMDESFSPLKGFMNKENYELVVHKMRLKNTSLFPLPITLDLSEEFASSVKDQKAINLIDTEGFSLAILVIEDIWEPDLKEEAMHVYGTTDVKHPSVNYLFNMSGSYYIGGKIIKVSMPRHYDYQKNRHTPKELKEIFKIKKWDKIIAFQTRNPLHRAHVELTLQASKEEGSKLLINPVVGLTKPGDIDHYTRVRCYKHAIKKYPSNLALLSLLPFAMRMGGPRETILHAIIRKNMGCTHLIVGRDHAGPGTDSSGNPFYGPYDAQGLLKKYENEIGIQMIPFKFMVYTPDNDRYIPMDDVKPGQRYETISGTQLRHMLNSGVPIPNWFTYKEVAKELQSSNPPIHKRGFTVFFTGLSGSGKSTLANGLLIKLLEKVNRPVTLLDGDIVRTHLSSELGFSKEHRALNIQRIGYVASEITKNRGIALCAPIAPYESDRKINRDLISNYGGFIEVYVNTSLEKCEERDSKGLYELARKGILKEFTGISDPYEKPLNSEIVINSSVVSPENLVDNIYDKIVELGYIEEV